MLTKTEYAVAKQLHRELWTWLAAHPSKLKSDWVGWRRRWYPKTLLAPKACYAKLRAEALTRGCYCFACVASAGDCLRCPVGWDTPSWSKDDMACVHSHAWAKWCSGGPEAGKAAQAIARKRWSMRRCGVRHDP